MTTFSFIATSLRMLQGAVLVLTVGCMLAIAANAAPKSKLGYTSFIVGHAADAQPSPLSPGLVLMGGGTDVDAAFQFMCQRAGGGDFVVIRTTGTDAYNPYIQQLCPQMDSVETIIITSVTGAIQPTSAVTYKTLRHCGSQVETSRHTLKVGAAQRYKLA
jgi:cyanophycinase